MTTPAHAFRTICALYPDAPRPRILARLVDRIDGDVTASLRGVLDAEGFRSLDVVRAPQKAAQSFCAVVDAVSDLAPFVVAHGDL